MSQEQAAESPPASEESVPGRRNVIVDIFTGFLSFILVAVPSTIGGIFFLDPILRKKKLPNGSGGGDVEGFVKVPLTSDAIPADGTPVPVSIRSDQIDAWNLYKDVPIGSVWIRRTEAGLKVFNSVCPHLGCRVGYRPTENDFYCPCHESRFTLEGEKTNDTPPRNMDDLEVKEVDGTVYVKYQNFKGGIADKTAI